VLSRSYNVLHLLRSGVWFLSILAADLPKSDINAQEESESSDLPKLPEIDGGSCEVDAAAAGSETTPDHKTHLVGYSTSVRRTAGAGNRNQKRATATSKRRQN
jgi:hypothetical protein